MIYRTRYFYLFPLLILLGSCIEDVENINIIYYSDEEYSIILDKLDIPKELDDFSVSLPEHLFFNDGFDQPPITNNAMATLGRVLFYDTRLSVTGTISCASCHQQIFAFGDNKEFSEGINNQLTSRNSLSLAAAPNLSASYSSPVSQASFGWDHANRESTSQSKAAILSSSEMGNADMSQVVLRLRQDPIYSILSRKAFSNDQLNQFLILNSLDAFMNSIASFDTPFDKGLKDAPGHSPFSDFSNFTVEENLGKQLYLNHCAACHGEKQDIQVKPSANNGLDLLYKDKGIGEIQGAAFDGVFKIPFLRNSALTAPYMHDGRFETLRAVVEHYNSGIQLHRNLDENLKDVQNGLIVPKKLNLNDSEIDALVSFLHTLTDESLQTTKKYSDPFK